MSPRIKLMLTVFIVSLSIIASTFAVREVTRGVLLKQTHDTGENRLLTYVGDLRRTLSRFHFLPYLIAEHQSSLALLQGDSRLSSEVASHLSQLDKAAITRGWHILTPGGQLVVSSLNPAQWKPDDGEAIAEILFRHGGEVVTFSYLVEGEARFYLAAPIYAKSQLIGIAVVRIALETLTDSWLASNELVLISDENKKFFLSSSQTLNPQRLNQVSDLAFVPLELFDGTSTVRLNLNGNDFLVQRVQLDDLRWNIYYLTPLANLDKIANWVGFVAIVMMALLLALSLFIYERRQKLRSQQQLQQLVVKSEYRLRRMISKTNVGLLLLNSEGKISFANPTALTYFNLSESLASDIFAWQLFETFTGNSSVMALLKSLPKNQEIGDLTGVEAMAQRSDGSRFPVLFSMTMLPGHSKTGFLVTVIDISKRKKAENALRAANQDLEQRVSERTAALQEAQEELVLSSKMAALGRMSSAITHELNQPLTGIKTLLSSSEVLIERGRPDMMISNMKLVDSLVDRMAGMTKQLKTFAFNRPEQLIPVSVAETIEQVLRIHQSRLEEVDVSLYIPRGLPEIQGEAQRLSLVFGNLIVNALDAMEGRDDPSLTITATATNEKVQVKVTDNGAGVTEEALSHLFEPFYTSKKIGVGLGLGLAISANSVRDMKGSINAVNNSSQQQGASIDSVLPANQGSAGMTFSLTFLRA